MSSIDVTIGRPPIHIAKDGTETFLPVHSAFQESKARFRIAVIHRRGRKTSMALEEMAKYLISNPGITGKTLAPKLNQAREIIWNDPDMAFKIFPKEIIKNVNRSELRIDLVNGSMWYLDGADDPHTQRGGNAKVLHLTEAGDHHESVWNQVYEPVLMANRGVAIIEGNPRGNNWYKRLYFQAQERKDWETFLLSARNSPIFTKEQLDDIQANNPEAVFASEYLCEWVDSIGVVFRTFRKRAIATEKPAEWGKRYRIAVDLAKFLDYTVVSVVDMHTWEQVYIERWNEVDWTYQKERIKDIVRKYAQRSNGNSVELMPETNGVGNPIFDDLQEWAVNGATREKEPLDIEMKIFTMTSPIKNLIVNNFSMLCDQGIIKILPFEPLINELELFTYEKTASTIKYGAPDGYHDDCVIATLMSFWELGGKLPAPLKPTVDPSRTHGNMKSLIKQAMEGGGGTTATDPYSHVL